MKRPCAVGLVTLPGCLISNERARLALAAADSNGIARMYIKIYAKKIYQEMHKYAL